MSLTRSYMGIFVQRYLQVGKPSDTNLTADVLHDSE